MAGSIATRGVVVAALIAVLYQFFIRDFLSLLGITRTVQPASDFPYECRRLNDPDLAYCEDMWYEELAKQLYLSCSTLDIRRQWIPNMGMLEAPASPQGERIIVVDTDKPAGDTYQHRTLKFKNFDSLFYGLAITGKRRSPWANEVGFHIINNKPTLDGVGGVPVDNVKTGANTTIEQFTHQIGSDELVHLHTWSHPYIATPNNIAVARDGGIYITNDHGLHKSGIQHTMSMFIFTGNVVHCKPIRDYSDKPQPECEILDTGHSFPNGILIPENHPSLLFVASAGFGGYITIYDIIAPLSSDDHPTLRIKQKVRMPMPVDNLIYEQATDSVFAAGIANVPQTLDIIGKIKTLTRKDLLKSAQHSVLRLFPVTDSAGNQIWEVETVLEDHDGSVLPGLTTSARDAKGSIWNSGILSPFLTVCDVKGISG